MLGISDRQFYQTMKMRSDDGHVNDVRFRNALDHSRNWYITPVSGRKFIDAKSLQSSQRS